MKTSSVALAQFLAFAAFLQLLANGQRGSCLQQQQQGEAVAVLNAAAAGQQQLNNKQQPQQQQQPQAALTAPQSDPQAGASPTAINTSSTSKQLKANHRLVSKIKDARHRRRHRHQRHRYHHHRHHNRHHQSLVEKAAPIMLASSVLADQVAQTSSSSLTALESIVEEVARAGQQQQLPAPQASQQQQQSQPQQQPQATSSGGGEVLLDAGSSSPATSLQQASLPSSVAPTHQQSPAGSGINAFNGGVTRQTPYNSRGFFLTSMLSKIMNVLNVTEFALEMRDGISSRASCMACNAVVGLFLSPLYSKEVFSAAIRTVCTSFKIQPARVCAGLVESFQDDFEYIRKNTKLTRDEVCAVVFGVDCARRQTYNLFWTVPIPEQLSPPSASSGGSSSIQANNKQQPTTSAVEPGVSISGLDALTSMDDAPDLFEYRKSTAAASSVNKQQAPIAAGADKPALSKSGEGDKQQEPAKNLARGAKMLMKRPEYIFDDELLDNASERQQTNKLSTFVHITDIHIDPYYEPGSLNDCNEPLCCRATSGPVSALDKRRQAGRWGDYGNCDTPVRTLRSALNRIREQHANAEYWLWTGDISPHDIWNISKSEAANHVRLVSKLVRDYSNGLPVFPVIGNHEAHPVNSFSPPEIKGKFSMSWLYDLLADEWSDWLPKDALKTLRVGGFYKLQVRKGFRIIALNTNYCARLNPWSFYDPVDPANQLKWLVDELLEAELNQDKVHIIGHVPPDNRECTQAWLFNFINIVDRFKETIVAQFYGHTHRDEWRLIYSLKRADEPIGIQYIGPSITPFTENNPAYRVYLQDKSGHLIDSETYYFNLTEANESPVGEEPNWRFSYRTQTHLNMTQGLTANEWHQYLQRLHDDEQLFDSFFKNYYRSSDVKTGQVCRAKCKYQMLSDLRLSHPYKTKPKPFLANRKTSNHHRDRLDHHHHHHKRLRHSE